MSKKLFFEEMVQKEEIKKKVAEILESPIQKLFKQNVGKLLKDLNAEHFYGITEMMRHEQANPFN